MLMSFMLDFIVLFPLEGKTAIVKYARRHSLDSYIGSALQGLRA